MTEEEDWKVGDILFRKEEFTGDSVKIFKPDLKHGSFNNWVKGYIGAGWINIDAERRALEKRIKDLEDRLDLTREK